MWKPVFLPRSGKNLIWIVLYCNCGTLIWGLRNLGIFQGETGLFFLRHAKKSKSTQCVLPRQGMLSMQWKAPQRGRFYVLFASTKRTKSSPEGCDPLDSGDGSKLYRLCFFVILPALVPTPACGATHFFGCFEPVRKGYCSADARPLFFENGML